MSDYTDEQLQEYQLIPAVTILIHNVLKNLDTSVVNSEMYEDISKKLFTCMGMVPVIVYPTFNYGDYTYEIRPIPVSSSYSLYKTGFQPLESEGASEKVLHWYISYIRALCSKIKEFFERVLDETDLDTNLYKKLYNPYEMTLNMQHCIIGIENSSVDLCVGFELKKKLKVEPKLKVKE